MKKTEIDLAHWREHMESSNRFHNFWASVSSVKLANTVRDDTARAIIEATERVK